MEALTLRLPGELREQLTAEAAERGVSVDEHIRDIIAVHCRGNRRQRSPDIEVAYAHSVAAAEQTEHSGDDAVHGDIVEIESFTYGSRSILS